MKLIQVIAFLGFFALGLIPFVDTMAVPQASAAATASESLSTTSIALSPTASCVYACVNGDEACQVVTCLGLPSVSVNNRLTATAMWNSHSLSSTLITTVITTATASATITSTPTAQGTQSNLAQVSPTSVQDDALLNSGTSSDDPGFDMNPGHILAICVGFMGLLLLAGTYLKYRRRISIFVKSHLKRLKSVMSPKKLFQSREGQTAMQSTVPTVQTTTETGGLFSKPELHAEPRHDTIRTVNPGEPIELRVNEGTAVEAPGQHPVHLAELP